jgi:hypothetical protein
MSVEKFKLKIGVPGFGATNIPEEVKFTRAETSRFTKG